MFSIFPHGLLSLITGRGAAVATQRTTQLVLLWRDFLFSYSQNPLLHPALCEDIGKIAIALPYLCSQIDFMAPVNKSIDVLVAELGEKYLLAKTNDKEKQVLDLISLATSLINQRNNPTYDQFSAQCG